MLLNRNLIFLLLTPLLVISACQTVPQQSASEVTAAPQTETVPKAEQPEITKQPAPEQKVQTQQQQLNQQALESVKAGDIDKAIAEFKQIIASEPALPHAYTNLGLLYLHQNKLEPAAQAFEHAIEIDNRDAIAYNNLAVIQRRRGEFKKALFNYYKAINNKPDYAAAHLNLGILLDLYLPDLPSALEQYQSYQKLTGGKDEKVSKWIIDIKQRIKAGARK